MLKLQTPKQESATRLEGIYSQDDSEALNLYLSWLAMLQLI
jgi:hypothetical protein